MALSHPLRLTQQAVAAVSSLAISGFVQQQTGMLPKGVGQAVKNIPTGGMSPQAVADRQQMRAGNPESRKRRYCDRPAPVNMQGTAKALPETMSQAAPPK